MIEPTADRIRDVLEHFKEKRSSFASNIPSVAGPIFGGLAGERLGRRIGGKYALPIQLTGTILGAATGKTLQDRIEGDASPPSMSMPIPSGAPYAIDPTVATDDIPPWALMGARILRAQKMGAFDSATRDMLLGELPPYAMYEGARQGGVKGLIKGTVGQGLGGILGAGAGMLAGHGLSKLVGRDYKVPLINMPVSHLLMGLGGTIGATKGLQYALPGRH